MKWIKEKDVSVAAATKQSSFVAGHIYPIYSQKNKN